MVRIVLRMTGGSHDETCAATVHGSAENPADTSGTIATGHDDRGSNLGPGAPFRQYHALFLGAARSRSDFVHVPDSHRLQLVRRPLSRILEVDASISHLQLSHSELIPEDSDSGDYTLSNEVGGLEEAGPPRLHRDEGDVCMFQRILNHDPSTQVAERPISRRWVKSEEDHEASDTQRRPCETAADCLSPHPTHSVIIAGSLARVTAVKIENEYLAGAELHYTDLHR